MLHAWVLFNLEKCLIEIKSPIERRSYKGTDVKTVKPEQICTVVKYPLLFETSLTWSPFVSAHLQHDLTLSGELITTRLKAIVTKVCSNQQQMDKTPFWFLNR